MILHRDRVEIIQVYGGIRGKATILGPVISRCLEYCGIEVIGGI